MMRKLALVTALLVAGTLVFSGGIATAQQQGGMRHGMRTGPVAFSADRPLISFMLDRKAELGLSSEQVQALETLRAEFQHRAEVGGKEIGQAEKELRVLVSRDQVDLAKAEEKIKEISGGWAAIRLDRIQTVEKGKALLTPDQLSKLKTLTAEPGS